MNGAGESFNLLVESFQAFKMSVENFSQKLEKIKTETILGNELSQRIMNDQIMLLERIFLLPQGLPGRSNYRHSFFSPSKFNAYSGAALPGISDLLHGVDKLSQEEKKTRFKELRKHLSDLMIVFRQAASWLSDDIE